MFDLTAAGTSTRAMRILIRSPYRLTRGTLRLTIQGLTRCAFASQEIGRQVACWAHSCLGRQRPRLTSGSTVYATALFSGLSVDAINDLDLSYTPPFGTPWDAVQHGVQAWEGSLRVTSAA